MRHRKALALVLTAAALLTACTFTRNDSTVTIPEAEFTPDTSDKEGPAPSSPVGGDEDAEPVLDVEPPVEYEEGSVYYEGMESRDGASSGGESSLVMATPQPIQDVEIREFQELKAGQCNDNLRFNEFQAFLREVFPDHTRLVEDRIVITVEREDGSPVHGAVVTVKDEPSVPMIRTGSDGKAYLFPGLLGIPS